MPAIPDPQIAVTPISGLRLSGGQFAVASAVIAALGAAAIAPTISSLWTM